MSGKSTTPAYIFLCFLSVTVNAQPDIQFRQETNQIILENSYCSRTLQIDTLNHACYTISLSDQLSDYEYCRSGRINEFSFSLNGNTISGSAESGQFRYTQHKILETEPDEKTLLIELSGLTGSHAEGISVSLYYRLYGDMSAIRKWMEITNQTGHEVIISDLFWESLLLDPWGGAGSDIYAGYGRYWHKPPYEGGKDDPAILVRGKKGQFILGNEAPGMMKYISVFKDANNLVNIGMTPSGHEFPFRKHLRQGEVFTSPKSFIILSREEQPDWAFEKDLGAFIRRHLGVKLFARVQKPLFLYNTWRPFRTDISDGLVREIADSLVGTGVEYLIIDDGWQDHYGDWNPHPEKFPDGIQKTCTYIRSRGMKPGFWISLTSVEKQSEAYKVHEDHMVKDRQGNNANIHGFANNLSFTTANILNQEWYDYMFSKISLLVSTCKLEYVKIDLSMVKSAYILDPSRNSSHDTTEVYHGQDEFRYLAFNKLMQFHDELAAAFPDLVIDCTFEIWGDWHIIDYALVQHADVDWISNLEADPPAGSRNIRHLAWHHGLTVPTAAMVVGNQAIDAPGHKFSFISNMGNMPIMLGDPRNLTEEEKEWYHKHHKWLRDMETKYRVMEFYQTARLFDKPSETNWDGFARFNTELQGGIICFFRNDSPEQTRTFSLPWIEQDASYRVYSVEQGSIIGTYSGKELFERGLSISISTRNTAAAYSVEKIQAGKTN